MKTTHNLLRAAATNPGSKSAQSGMTVLDSLFALAIFAILVLGTLESRFSVTNYFEQEQAHTKRTPPVNCGQ